MKKLFPILLISVLLVGCDNPKNIFGHWHLTSDDPNFVNHFVIDVINDTLVVSDKNSLFFYEALKGVHNMSEKHLLFSSGSCGACYFKYEVTENKIFLESLTGYSNYKGVKCEDDCCDKLEDVINKEDIFLDINFPQIVENRKNHKIKNEPLDNYVACLFIGKPKKQFIKEYGNDFRFQIYDEIIEDKEIDLWILDEREKLEESEQNSISYKIIAAKETPIKKRKFVIEKLKSLGVNKIFFTK